MNAIEVQNITKIYKLYDHPKLRLKEALNPFGSEYHRKFYALKNITFNVQKGETLAILGSNGAGKSTLLKLISTITKPSFGTIKTHGKVSSLLELGTGFNPQLSGADNIYLAGMIRGLSHKEIREKFDEIVEFSELKDFIKQPVKTYSSGMFAKLAFSVAVSIEPDILILDEVLSVGDINFRAKSMEKMKQMIEGNCTVLFVSHDINAVKTLCKKAIYLKNGELVAMGESAAIADMYIADKKGEVLQKTLPSKKTIFDVSSFDYAQKVSLYKKHLLSGSTSSGTYQTEIEYALLLDDNKEVVNHIGFKEKVTLEIGIKINDAAIESLVLAYYIKDKNFVEVTGTNSIYENLEINVKNKQRAVVTFSFKNYLKQGVYYMQIIVANNLKDTIYYHFLDNCLSIESKNKHGETRWALVAPEILSSSVHYIEENMNDTKS